VVLARAVSGVYLRRVRLVRTIGLNQTSEMDDRVSHRGQPIVLAVAETLEQASHAATLVRVA
jgi:CO/xanthine dehydrogenase Mo-binding subunit